MSTLAPGPLVVAPSGRFIDVLPRSQPRRIVPLESLRVCYLCSDLGIPIGGTNGASAHVRGLARAFGELGHRVTLLSPRLDGPEAVGVPTVPIRVTPLADEMATAVPEKLLRALAHTWNNVGVEQALASHLPRLQPDLLYERYSPFSTAGGAVAQRLGIPHVLEVNAPLAWEGKVYWQQALQGAADALEQAAFAQASLILTVSDELARFLVEQGVPEEKVAVVPNGVEVQLFKPVGTSVDLPAERFVIGFVGSLKSRHGVEVLARCFSRLAANPRYHLLVVGDGPERGVLRELEEQFPGQVTLTGAVPQSEVGSYLRAMHVAVAPYPRLERFYFSPLKVLEYMAAGRAIVASRIGQLEALIEHGHTGVLVEPGDDEMLAGAIDGLAEDERHRRAMGMAAARSAWSGHRWTHRVEEILRWASRVTDVTPAASGSRTDAALEARA